MCNALAKRRILGRDLVEVHVEIVARQTTKGHDVGLAHGAAVGEQALANLQLFKVAAEGVNLGFDQLGAAHVLAGHSGDHGGRALQRGALHQVLDGADAAEFFTPTSTAGAAVFERG